MRASGRSIGTPGAVRVLELAFKEHGNLAWKELFDPAIKLANNGFPIAGRMAAAIAASRNDFLRDADARASYLEADGSAKALGAIFKLPAYAETLTTIANNGADAFYTGPIAQAIVDKINNTTTANDGSPITSGKATLADLANYQARKRAAVCITYRLWNICGMPPPSGGGMAVASALGILENVDLGIYKPLAIDGEGG